MARTMKDKIRLCSAYHDAGWTVFAYYNDGLIQAIPCDSFAHCIAVLEGYASLNAAWVDIRFNGKTFSSRPRPSIVY